MPVLTADKGNIRCNTAVAAAAEELTKVSTPPVHAGPGLPLWSRLARNMHRPRCVECSRSLPVAMHTFDRAVKSRCGPGVPEQEEPARQELAKLSSVLVANLLP
jgi:hypothetical protein